MKMKHNFSGLILMFFMPLLAHAVVGGVSQNFESGNRVIERGYCWQFIGTSISSTNKISGNYSGYTSALNNPADPRRFISPWIEFTGDDEISFQHKVTSLNGATAHFIQVSLIALNGNTTQILDFQYPNTQVQSHTLTVNVTGIFQVQWLINSTGGGSSRGVIDDIFISGNYMADPTNNPNGSGACAPLLIEDDADHDGVPDDEDEYPDDRSRAFNNYTPAQGYGTLTVEDLWPRLGDYDFNDFVIRYRINQVTNSSNDVVEIHATFTPQAAGSGIRNGFGFMLPLPASAVTNCTGSSITGNYINFTDEGIESGQQNAVVIVLDNARNMFTDISGTNPDGITGVNSYTGGKTGTGTPIEIAVYFAQPVNPELLGNPPYNPFLIVNSERGKEIHLPDYPPTDLADPSLFGTSDDASDPGLGRYYRSSNNLPWMLNLASGFDHPIEKTPIQHGYLKFIEWAMSGGRQYGDWQMDLDGYRNPQNIYQADQ